MHTLAAPLSLFELLYWYVLALGIQALCKTGNETSPDNCTHLLRSHISFVAGVLCHRLLMPVIK